MKDPPHQPLPFSEPGDMVLLNWTPHKEDVVPRDAGRDPVQTEMGTHGHVVYGGCPLRREDRDAGEGGEEPGKGVASA